MAQFLISYLTALCFVNVSSKRVRMILENTQNLFLSWLSLRPFVTFDMKQFRKELSMRWHVHFVCFGGKMKIKTAESKPKLAGLKVHENLKEDWMFPN